MEVVLAFYYIASQQTAHKSQPPHPLQPITTRNFSGETRLWCNTSTEPGSRDRVHANPPILRQTFTACPGCPIQIMTQARFRPNQWRWRHKPHRGPPRRPMRWRPLLSQAYWRLLRPRRRRRHHCQMSVPSHRCHFQV